MNERQPFTGFFSITCKASDVRLIKGAWRRPAKRPRLNFIIEEEKFPWTTKYTTTVITSFDRVFHNRMKKKTFRFDSSSFQKSTFHHSRNKFLESLQWIGETGLREAAEGRVVTAKLVCRDASQKSKLPGVFTPCVAFRVAGSQSKTSRYSHRLSSSSRTRKLNYIHRILITRLNI